MAGRSKKLYSDEIERIFGRYVKAGHLPEGHCLYVAPEKSTPQNAHRSSSRLSKLAFYAVSMSGLETERAPELAPESEPEEKELKQLTAQPV